MATVQSTPVGDQVLIGTKSMWGTETQRILKAQNPGLAFTEIIFPMMKPPAFQSQGYPQIKPRGSELPAGVFDLWRHV